MVTGSRVSHHLRGFSGKSVNKFFCSNIDFGHPFVGSIGPKSPLSQSPILSDCLKQLNTIFWKTNNRNLTTDTAEIIYLEDDREPPSEQSSLGAALGKFDALHIGHRELAIQAAKAGVPWLLSCVGMAEVLGWEPRLEDIHVLAGGG